MPHTARITIQLEGGEPGAELELRAKFLAPRTPPPAADAIEPALTAARCQLCAALLLAAMARQGAILPAPRALPPVTVDTTAEEVDPDAAPRSANVVHLAAYQPRRRVG